MRHYHNSITSWLLFFTASVILLLTAFLQMATSLANPRPGETCTIQPEALVRLQKDLVGALGSRFEFIDGVLVKSSRGNFWLARIRAIEPGEVLIRYSSEL